MKTRTFVLPLAAVGMASLLATAILARPPSLTLVLPSGAALQAWRADWIRLVWPAAIALAAGVSALAWRLSASIPSASRLGAVRPLAWLPLVGAASHAGTLVGSTAAGLVLPFGAALVAAACVERFFFSMPEDPGLPLRPGRRHRSSAAAMFLAAFALLAAVWIGHAKAIGWRGGGDAKHYIVQLENLLERGDLDLTDRMEAAMARRGVRTTGERAAFLVISHIKENADGRIHSGHSFGYPLLAWPLVFLVGPVGEELLRILLGALALSGCLACCRAVGASPRSSFVPCALVGLTVPFVYTALSFLPEMLGFCLCAWAAWGAFAQDDPRNRISATLVSGIACSFLPYAHVRFAPMTLALAFLFGIEGLCTSGEPFGTRKLPRLAAFSAVCLVAWLVLWRIHSAFFQDDGAYDYGSVFLSHPRAMWGVLADRYGLAAVLPAIWALAAAPWRALSTGRRDARRALLALLVFASVLLSCCGTIGALNGACLPGRYLFPVVPVLLPFLALALDRTDRTGRLWILFLLVLPVLYFVFVSFALSKNGLIASPDPLRRFSRLQAFWQPLPSLYFSGTAASRTTGTLFAVLGIAVSFLACGPGRRPVLRKAAFAVLLAAMFALGRATGLSDPPDRLDSFTILSSDRGLRSFRLLSGPAGTLFDAFREPGSDVGADRPAFALSGDPSVPEDSAVHFHRTDRPGADVPEGRAPRRLSLRGRNVAPTGRPGTIAFRVRGRVENGVALFRLVSDGSPVSGETAVPAGPFDIVLRGATAPTGAGSNVQVALDGDRGTVFVDAFDFAPCPPGLETVLPAAPPAAFKSEEPPP